MDLLPQVEMHLRWELEEDVFDLWALVLRFNCEDEL
jgi:hypothetical protein